MSTPHVLKRHGATLALVLLGLAAPMAASARQAGGGDGNASFQSLDRNQDGRLSRSEIPADMPLLRTRLDTYDANHDGMLDAREYTAAQAALHGGGKAGASETPPAPKPHNSASPTGGG